MKKISITILGLLVAFASLAQGRNLTELKGNYPDSLILDTDSKSEITFMFNRLGRDKQYFTSELWKSMINVMETAIERSDKTEGIQVSYHNVGSGENESVKITISDLDPQESIFLINKDEMKEKLSSRIEFLIVQPQVAISFSIHDMEELEEIKELEVESVWSQIQAKYENKGKNNLYRGVGNIKYGKVSLEKITVRPGGVDFIEFSAGIGLGYYADRFVPSISYDLSFNLADRFGKPKFRFGALYTQHYFTTRDSERKIELDVNSFLSGYATIRSSSEREFGIGFGYLVRQNGDFFEGDTFIMSVYNKRSSKISISPELIFTDGFKKSYPAVRFGLTF